MTDNSDFMSRYLPPENPEQNREQAAPADNLTEEVSLPDLRLPEPASALPPQVPSPQLPTPPVGKYEFAPPPAQGGPAQGPDSARPAASGDEGAHASAPASAAPYEPRAQPSFAPRPQAGHPNAVPWLRAPGTDFSPPSGPISQQPVAIPARPQFDQRTTTPTTSQRWTPPRIDPSVRWAPRADLQSADSVPTRHVEVEEVVKTRREPAEIGWRKAVYVCTGGLVNLGAGPHERQLRDWQTRVTSNIPGNYQITAVSIKGGVGKTRVTAGVGTTFADERKQPVIAIDADATYGSLGHFVDPKAQYSIRDLLAAKDVVVDYPKARHFTGQNKQRLEVLAGNQNVANPMELDAATVFETVALTRRFYQLSLVDCGNAVETEFFKAVLSVSDALMIIGSCDAEGAKGIEKTVNWLAARNGHELLKRSVIVLNKAGTPAGKGVVAHVTERLGPRVRSVKTIPWDPHLREAATLDFAVLRKRTRLAFLELAAELSEGFPTAGALSA
ncbi:MinD/ParA family ATP-binding protein [Mycobacterium riyadhense]|uniref:MinD/ParA family ATP-binding protein n=1 Tax=Mycobacterium riyadhense TaxID=486698 RepID=UPI00195A2A83|nr:MinD/ParA family protein [Mycobacterium riyadhense]